MELPKTNLKDGYKIESNSKQHLEEKNYVSISIEVKKGYLLCYITYMYESREDGYSSIFSGALKTVNDAKNFLSGFDSYSSWWKNNRRCECDLKAFNKKFRPAINEIKRMIRRAEK